MANTNNYFDYNIAFLRPLLCLGVICFHFTPPTWPIHPYVLSCCVPIFFIISFYLLQMNYSSKGIQSIQKRFSRLYIPFISWGVIFYLVNNGIFLIFHTGEKLSINQLLLQILAGYSYNSPLWFLVVLLVITALFYIVALIAKQISTIRIIFAILALIAIISEYTGLNYKIFSSFGYSFRFTLGRICEMIPFAFFGLIIPNILKLDLKKQYIIAVIATIVSLSGPIIYRHLPGFSYQGIYFFIALSIFIVFHSIPFERLPERVLTKLKKLSRFTLGIYCSHLLFGHIIVLVLRSLGIQAVENTYLLCLIIYVSCFCLFYLADKFIRNKYIRMLWN